MPTLKKISSLFALTAFTFTCIAGAVPAGADTAFDQNLDYIVTSVGVEANDQAVRTEMLDALQEYAQKQGLTLEQAAQQVADEARSYSTNTSSTDTAAPHPSVLGSGSNKNLVSMGKAQYIGDIFYSSNSRLGITYGHNGIYYDLSNYVESAGFSEGVKKTYAGLVVAPAPAHKYYVGQDEQNSTKIEAARFALEQVGKDYNGVFFDNKNIYSDTYNCSQLVWAAYKSADPSIDLDSDGGPGVYPADIANSHWTTLYETRS